MRDMNSPANPFRLAMATDTWLPQLNGVTRTLDRLVREGRSRGFDVRVYTPADPTARTRDGVTCFPSRAFAAYPTLRMAWPGGDAVAAAWRDWVPDLVHAATPFGVGLAARAAARARGIPFVTSYHTSLSAYAAFYRLGWLARPGWHFLRWFHNSGLATWCPTRAIADDLMARGFERVGIWGRGVDAAAFHPQFRSLAFRRDHGIADGDFLVTYVGRIAREKGLESLLTAIRGVSGQTSRPVRLMLVGDGPFEAGARDLAPAGTVFTGTLSGHALATAFASADLFAFPSTTDTFGNVVLEAMASGVPVLAAEGAVTRELLGSDGGFFFDSVAALGTAVTRLAADEPSRQRAAAVGLGKARSRTWDAIFDGLFAEYREQARRGRPAPTPSAPTTSLVRRPGFVAHS